MMNQNTKGEVQLSCHYPNRLFYKYRQDNRFRHFRNDLYLGDDPIFLSTTPAAERGEKAKERLRARKRISELKKRRKAKERKQRLKQTGEKSPAESPLATARAAALNETIMSRLDLSCFMKARRKGFAKAPPLENAYPAKYARRKNVLPPYNRYLVAVYKCTEGYVFEDSTADRLFCSDGTWLGALPRCVKVEEATPNNVKRCNQDHGGCEHVCEDTQTGVRCSCFDGFRVKGSSCIDVDECAEGTAGCAQICQNSAGSFHCECRSGFQLGTDNKSCLDVNECLVNNGHGPCQGTCSNREGSYECSCADIPGHKLAPDNHTCEDIDECFTNNGGCSHVCLNTPGSAFCLCPDGFYLTNDWKTCQDVNECENASKVCANNTDCENTIGSFKCVSKPQKMTKVLQDEDYDAEDDDDDYDEEEGVTEVPEFGKCEDGFRKNTNGECIGSYIFCYIIPLILVSDILKCFFNIPCFNGTV
ncbi:hypothetical protein K0M31_002643 [Melipona bicolor]|uniref:EGF-like domain-containing protein n=1 Tax=Melipona bicolor TaxID=60889 RepID=A0AA40FZC6_9HYME|nr:hypothetical protein K0M31_002643 [Melipona bicolor]